MRHSEVSRYALGESDAERQRLARQSRRLRTITRRFLRDAGIAPGMRILELGTGLGHVTRLLGRLVGGAGRIVSLEHSAVMLDQARQGLERNGVMNVDLVQCDLNDLQVELTGPFDALVGRLILTHLDDPAATVRGLVAHLAPGGIVAFQESDTTLSEHLLWLARDELPLTRQVCGWIELARQASAMQPRIGLQLPRIFALAGLPSPTVSLHTEVYQGHRPERVRNTVMLLRHLLPRLEAIGIGADTIGFDSLDDRLTAELMAADVVQAQGSLASAWSVTLGT